MKFNCECMYCGHKWENEIFVADYVNTQVCPKCGDSNLKIKDAKADKVDYYEGCPPFPSDNDDDYDYAADKKIFDLFDKSKNNGS